MLGPVKWAGVLADGVVVPAARALAGPVFAVAGMVFAAECTACATTRAVSALGVFVFELEWFVRAVPALA